jgi:hypothetical protein
LRRSWKPGFGIEINKKPVVSQLNKKKTQRKLYIFNWHWFLKAWVLLSGTIIFRIIKNLTELVLKFYTQTINNNLDYRADSN